MAVRAAPERTEETAAQRVRVGLTGLAFVFLLVMLATAFLHASEERGAVNRAVTANDATPTEPLAALGVAPGNGPPDSVPARPRATTAPR